MRIPRVPAKERYRLIMECRKSGMSDYRWCLITDIYCETYKCPVCSISNALLWCVYENGEIYPCGICKNEKSPSIRKMDSDNCNCPFDEEL